MSTYINEDKCGHSWVSDIYEIGVHDPLMGGEFGINNVQARQLAQRTMFLARTFLSYHFPASVPCPVDSADIDGAYGGHFLCYRDIAENQCISEYKFDFYGAPELKDAPKTADGTVTSGMLAACTKYRNDFDALYKALLDMSLSDGTSVAALYKALQLSWEYSGNGMYFSLFTDDFNFDPVFRSAVVTHTVGRDDSIDILVPHRGELPASSTVEEGGEYILVFDDGSYAGIVTVRSILEDGRLILAEDLPDGMTTHEAHLVSSMLTTRAITDESTGTVRVVASAKPGDMFYTKTFSGFYEDESVLFCIQSSESSGSAYEVLYRTDDSDMWEPAEFVSVRSAGDGENILMYSLSGGPGLRFRVRATTESDITAMSVCSDTAGTASKYIRRPVFNGPRSVVRYGGLYDIGMDSFEVSIAHDELFSDADVHTYTKADLEAAGIDLESPIMHFDALLDSRITKPYVMRARWFGRMVGTGEIIASQYSKVMRVTE